MGQNPVLLVNFPIPTKIGSKRGGEFAYPKMGSQNGFDSWPCGFPHFHCPCQVLRLRFLENRGAQRSSPLLLDQRLQVEAACGFWLDAGPGKKGAERWGRGVGGGGGGGGREGRARKGRGGRGCMKGGGGSKVPDVSDAFFW